MGGQSGEGGGEGQGECDHRRGAPEVPDSIFLNFFEIPATRRDAAAVIARGGAGVGEI